jgi:hypothetical protein
MNYKVVIDGILTMGDIVKEIFSLGLDDSDDEALTSSEHLREKRISVIAESFSEYHSDVARGNDLTVPLLGE